MTQNNAERIQQIWLEVTRVRFEYGADGVQSVSVQVRGDKADEEPVWWPVDDKAAGSEPEKTYRNLIEALDKKRVVLVALRWDNTSLRGKAARIQSPADAGAR